MSNLSSALHLFSFLSFLLVLLLLRFPPSSSSSSSSSSLVKPLTMRTWPLGLLDLGLCLPSTSSSSSLYSTSSSFPSSCKKPPYVIDALYASIQCICMLVIMWSSEVSPSELVVCDPGILFFPQSLFHRHAFFFIPFLSHSPLLLPIWDHGVLFPPSPSLPHSFTLPFPSFSHC